MRPGKSPSSKRMTEKRRLQNSPVLQPLLLLYPIIFASCVIYARKRKGFRACGRDQGAFRSPFGNLRAHAWRKPCKAGGQRLSFTIRHAFFQQSAAPGANRYRLAPGALCIYLWLCREEPAPDQSGATSTVSSASTGRFMGREATPKAQRACLPCSPNTSTSKSLRPLATCGCWVNSGVEAT